MEEALQGDGVSVAVVDVDWSVFAKSYRALRPRPLLEEVAMVSAVEVTGMGDEGAALMESLRSLEPEDRAGAMLGRVCMEIAAVLGVKRVEDIDPEDSLDGMGLDSLMAVQLRERFSGLTGTSLGATLAFDYPTPKELGEYLLGLMFVDEIEKPTEEPLQREQDPVSAVDVEVGEPALDVESMETDDLLSLLRSKYGEEGDT
jgi:acyl carrier protein